MRTDIMGESDLDLVVASRQKLADRVIELILTDRTGQELPHWDAGAHIDLTLGSGLTRQYSLCGDPSDRSCYRIGVLQELESRGGSKYIHEQLMTGVCVRAGASRNHFPLQQAPNYLFVGGGIGITPLIPMIASAERAGADWRLIYGGRTRASMAFVDELQLRYSDRVVICPPDESGLLDLAAILADPCEGRLVYCCGPEALLSAVEARCVAWPSGSLHIERFAPRVTNPALPDNAFEVELSESRKTLYVPAGQSVLDVLLEAGVDVLCACSQGTCGTCETVVLQGEIDHRDSVLTPEERATHTSMMICVSRAASPRIVLKL